jgi:hypothetical protein
MNIKKINDLCHTKLFIKTLIVLFGITVYGHNAFAMEDGKVYPGSNCHYGALTPSGNVKYDSTGFIYNNSTTNSALISCPIVRDKVFSVAGLNFIKIRYKKPNSTGFHCVVHSRTSFGTAGFQKSKWDFGPGGIKTMILDDIGGFSAGSYTLSCILPPSKAPVSNAANRAGIFYYQIHEK